MSEKVPHAQSRQKCRELMSKNVRTATGDTTLKDVAAMMRDGDMGSVPIVDGNKLVLMENPRMFRGGLSFIF